MDYGYGGGIYEGEFSRGKINGYGRQIHSDGRIYIGFQKDGLYHGHGTMTYPNGDIKSGMWSNDVFQQDKNQPQK